MAPDNPSVSLLASVITHEPQAIPAFSFLLYIHMFFSSRSSTIQRVILSPLAVWNTFFLAWYSMLSSSFPSFLRLTGIQTSDFPVHFRISTIPPFFSSFKARHLVEPFSCNWIGSVDPNNSFLSMSLSYDLTPHNDSARWAFFINLAAVFAIANPPRTFVPTLKALLFFSWPSMQFFGSVNVFASFGK